MNDEPGFVFSPPVLSHDIRFNVTTQTLDNDETFYYDVDSGSYEQLQFACGFQDGTSDALTNPHTVYLYIRQCEFNIIAFVYAA